MATKKITKKLQGSKKLGKSLNLRGINSTRPVGGGTN